MLATSVASVRASIGSMSAAMVVPDTPPPGEGPRAGRPSGSRAYRAVDRYVTNRLRRWLCKKHKVPGAGTSRFPDAYLYQHLGLIRLPTLTRNLPWAKA